MTADELRRLADECAAFPDATEGADDRDKANHLADRLEKALGTPVSTILLALLGYWDAFVALLPDGWGWSKVSEGVIVHYPAGANTSLVPMPHYSTIPEGNQPNHGVAAFLHALANEKEQGR